MYANIEEKYTLQEAREIIRQEEKEKSARYSYFLKQKMCGILLAIIGLIVPIIDNTAGMAAIVLVPLGLWLIFTREKVMLFDGFEE